MRIVRTIEDVRGALHGERTAGRRIGFVPTMGAFHEGHLALMRRARRECAVVVVSLFVNPAQFTVAVDLAAYPRDDARDAELADAAGVDLLFVPAVDEIYPPGFATMIEVHGVTEPLEGETRGLAHFRGVTTVVSKLFQIVQPDIAYFGQKDAQQCIVIRHLVRDLNIPVHIEICPTVREPDGLAMSSRNVRLSPAGRTRAVGLSEALRGIESGFSAGERSVNELTARARAALTARGITAADIEYLAVVDMETLTPVDAITAQALAAIAARVDGVRLIDNVILGAT